MSGAGERGGAGAMIRALGRRLRGMALPPVSQPVRKPARGQPAFEHEENALERTARALSEFVVRVVALPLTILLVAPSALVRAFNTGSYRPLPSPFLLSVVTGVVVSGVTSALLSPEVMQTQQTKALINSVGKFYDNMDGLESVIFAIPYLGLLWVLAGAISLAMGRGLRSAHILFVGLALSLGAIIEVAALCIITGLWTARGKGEKFALAFDLTAIDPPVLIGLSALSAILAYKLVRLVFILQVQAKSAWIGAVLAAAMVAFVVVAVGLGSALSVHWIVAGFGW